MSEGHVKPEDAELENALAALRPAGPGISRDALMFAAGARSARRRSRLWQGAACALAVLLTAAILLPRPAREVERIVYRPAPPAPISVPAKAAVAAVSPFTNEAAASTAVPNMAYLRLRQAVLERGPDALPASPHSTGEAPMTLRQCQTSLGM